MGQRKQRRPGSGKAFVSEGLATFRCGASHSKCVVRYLSNEGLADDVEGVDGRKEANRD